MYCQVPDYVLLACPKLTAACCAEAVNTMTVRYSVSSSRVFRDLGNSVHRENWQSELRSLHRPRFFFFCKCCCLKEPCTHTGNVEMQEGYYNTGTQLVTASTSYLPPQTNCLWQNRFQFVMLSGPSHDYLFQIIFMYQLHFDCCCNAKRRMIQ